MKRFTLISVIMVFVVIGANAYPWISPYAYCAWNPIKFVDPDGRRPVYSPDGELLGTDLLDYKEMR